MTNRAVEATDDVDTGAVLHAAAEVVAEATKGSESSESEPGKAEESSATQAGKAEASVTETGRHVESVAEVGKSVTEASKAAAKKSDASEATAVFADAEDFGARFQSFWDKHFSHRCAYDETTTIPAMCYTHDSDAYVRIMDTLQVVSVKVASIKEGLHWSLHAMWWIASVTLSFTAKEITVKLSLRRIHT